MLQTLFFIPNEIAGWPVFGFGLLLAAWIAACVAVLAWLVRKQGLVADTWGYLPLMAVMAAVIAWVLPVLCEPRGLPIRGYGMMILVAVVSGILLAAWRARRRGIDPEIIFSLAFWMILPGIVGARAVYVIEYWSEVYWPAYLENGLGGLLGAIVNVANGGLVVFGAFFGGIAGLLLFVWKYRIRFLATADVIAPSLALGVALGRIGCMLNGCCFGAECDLPWGVAFPWNSPAHIHQVEAGEASVAGLKLAEGTGGGVVVREVEPGSPADRAGLKPREEIREINGVPAANLRGADWALLSVNKLHIIVSGSGLPMTWTVDDPRAPPEAVPPGPIRIYGLEIAGRDDDAPVLTVVRPQSPERRFGLEPGQRIRRLNGRPAPTVGRLRALLEEHRLRPWLRLDVAGRESPVEMVLVGPLPGSLPVHPTQIYSVVDGLLLCLLLLAFSRVSRRDGEVTALMITVYPVTRFLIERLRSDEANILDTGMHISQLISLGLWAVAAAMWVYLLRQPRKTSA
ncbi:MAG: prolipoprotein diacylglyceryl transferase family protein [Thermoguttaceae bacterium]|jgi:phosphatidylglycerol:prolipoprotein diacylglycerol transferase